MAYFKKYYYSFRDIKNKEFRVEIYENLDLTLTYSTYVVTYAGKNYIYVTGDVLIYSIGDTLTGVGGGIPDGVTVTGIDIPNKLVYLNATGTSSNSPVSATLHKSEPIAEEVRGGDSPFVITYPEIDNKFQQVRGSGAEFNLLSTTNMQFIGLASGDMYRYMVKLIEIVYVTPIYTQEFTRWLGYINSEIYEEPFDTLDNYLVSLTANNGFALLNRISYSSEIDGSRYDTIASNWDTLFNVLYRIHLPYNLLFVGISTTINNVTIAENETIFHHIYTNPDNWYNEDGEPESFRTVLEKILEPLGAYIFQFDDNIYITDNNHISNSGTTQSFKVFDIQDNLTYLYTTLVNTNIGDLSNIGFATDKQTYSIIPAYNKQVINYNRYRVMDPLNYSAQDDGFTQQNIPSHTYGDSLYGYEVTTFQSSEFWTGSNGSNFIFFQGLGSENKNKFENGIRFQPKLDGFNISPEHLSFTNKSDLPYFISTGKYSLKLEAVVHPHTWSNFGKSPNTDDLSPEEFIIGIDVNAEIIIDNNKGTKKKYYNPYYQFVSGDTTSWVDVSTPNTTTKLRFTNPNKYKLIKADNWNPAYEYDACNDKDVELKVWRKLPQSTEDKEGNIVFDMSSSPFIIPLDTDISGRLVIKLYDFELRYYDFSQFPPVVSEIGAPLPPVGLEYFNFYLKELKGTIVDQYGNEVKKLDMEIIGDSKNSPLQPIYKDEGPDIKLYSGSNVGYFPTENGNLLRLTGSSINNQWYIPHTLFTRQGITDLPEYLLLRSIVSNYKDSFIQLNLTTNRIDQLLGYLTYNNYLGEKKFTITAMKRDVAESSDELTIQEFSEDNVTITKIFE